MNKHLTCNQVSALINFYIDGKLNQTLKEYVENHLAICPNCRKKVQQLKELFKQYAAPEPVVDVQLQKSLSAYIDNELNSNDNIKIKKLTISNINARKELENMYKFQKLIHSAYEHTKNDIKKDYSRAVVSKIANEEYYTTSYFKKIALLFVAILTAIISGFMYLYF